jgi:hypothetical protein
MAVLLLQHVDLVLAPNQVPPPSFTRLLAMPTALTTGLCCGCNQTEGAVLGGHYAVGQEWHPHAAPSPQRRVRLLRRAVFFFWFPAEEIKGNQKYRKKLVKKGGRL